MDKQNTISINIPNPVVAIEKLKNSILAFALEMYNGPVRQKVSPVKKVLNSLKNPFRNGFKLPDFDKKLLVKIVLPLIVVVIFVAGVVSLLRNFPNTLGSDGRDVNISLPTAVGVKELNKKLSFPLRDGEGEEVGSFDFVIENAELRKQIIVQGKRATAVQGRVFLILNLKLTNNLSQFIEIPTRNYLRIVVNDKSEELLAPDIHNDPVEVLGKSTKYTRLGLAINETDSENTIKLLVGEVDGDKQTIELDF